MHVVVGPRRHVYQSIQTETLQLISTFFKSSSVKQVRDSPDRLFLMGGGPRESLGGPPLFTLRGLVVGTALRRSDSGLARCCLADSLDRRRIGVISTWPSSGNWRQISSATPESENSALWKNDNRECDQGCLTWLDLLPVSANLDGFVVVPGIVEVNYF